MDKVTIMLIIFFVNISCSKKYKYDLKKDNLCFVFDKHIKINFKQGNLKINYLEFSMQDTIIFSSKEKIEIIQMFDNSNINKLKNEYWYIDEHSIMPPFHDEIKFLHNGKIKSHFFINFNYDIDTFQLPSDECKIVEFKNYVRKIVQNKSSYKKANDKLNKFIKTKNILLL